MNVMREQSPSEFESGCDSGWTSYLGRSDDKGCEWRGKDCGKEEDPSMVSDASSGPPACLIQEKSLLSCKGSSLSTPPSKKRRRVESRDHHQMHDTASSNLCSFSEASDFRLHPINPVHYWPFQRSIHLNGDPSRSSFSFTASSFKESTLIKHDDYVRSTSPKSMARKGKRSKNRN